MSRSPFSASHWSRSAQGTGETRTCMVQAMGRAGSAPCTATVYENVTFYATAPSGPPPTLAYRCAISDGLHCDDSTRACQPLKPVGASCSRSHECVRAAACDFPTGRCVAKVAVGERCTAQGTPCVDGAWCDGSSARCAPRQAPGTACTDEKQCSSNRCVNTVCEKESPGITLTFLCGSP